jgi:protoporphyrinogen oxidase
MSGLGAALAARAPVYEAASHCGGACHSYYRTLTGESRDPRYDDVADCFRFEPAGGHWLFGVSAAALERLRRFGHFREYSRRAATFFPESRQRIPYPLQENLRYLDREVREKILRELESCPSQVMEQGSSFEGWLQANFGPSLCELFFVPFNHRYTAGQLAHIAPQDFYKSPVDLPRVRQGAVEPVPDRGYNHVFHYPARGLDHLVREMSAECEVHLSHRVVGIDTAARRVRFENGNAVSYEHLISTLPLDQVAAMCGVRTRQAPDPATAVLVVNIAATKGRRCPSEHWVYVPASKSGMHRVGFYSNVDASFLPAHHGAQQELVSIYAERSYLSTGQIPDPAEQAEAARAIVEELEEWEFIEEPLIVDPTFTDPAYTWSRPGSAWTQEAMRALAANGIQQIGRYGTWKFQGMVASFEEGLAAGSRAAA